MTEQEALESALDNAQKLFDYIIAKDLDFNCLLDELVDFISKLE